MSDIFICYSSNDRGVALKLKKIFVNHGWTVFIDQDIVTGKRFHQEIERELAEAWAVVALWSKTSTDSDYVLDEATEGQARGILVPAVIENIKPPYGFRRIQTADLSAWDGSLQYSELHDRLLSSLSRLLDDDKESSGSKPDENDSSHNTQQKSRHSIFAFPEQGEVFRDKLKDGSEGPPMVVIPAGSFLMGSAPNDGYDYEWPQHKVFIQTPFALGQFPVTFADYDVYAKAEGQELPDDAGWGRKNRPAVNVSWENAQGYCQWLNQQTGREYRLPSEVEWEYAARAETSTQYWWGDESGKNLANFYGSGSEWSGKQISPVDAFKANPFGLYDVHGNVWEWCFDNWHGNYKNAPNDGSAWIEGSVDRRVVRGGSWNDYQGSARAAYRNSYAPDSRFYLLGFRLCCSSPIISE